MYAKKEVSTPSPDVSSRLDEKAIKNVVREMHNCSITAPEGWQLRAATVSNTIVDFSRTDEKKSIVRLFAFESDSDAKTVMENRDKALPNLCQQVEKVETRQILVSGVKAWETESKYSVANLGEFHEKAVYFANDGKVYMILCQAIAPDKYGEMVKDFDAIIGSFKFSHGSSQSYKVPTTVVEPAIKVGGEVSK